MRSTPISINGDLGVFTELSVLAPKRLQLIALASVATSLILLAACCRGLPMLREHKEPSWGPEKARQGSLVPLMVAEHRDCQAWPVTIIILSQQSEASWYPKVKISSHSLFHWIPTYITWYLLHTLYRQPVLGQKTPSAGEPRRSQISATSSTSAAPKIRLTVCYNPQCAFKF